MKKYYIHLIALFTAGFLFACSSPQSDAADNTTEAAVEQSETPVTAEDTEDHIDDDVTDVNNNTLTFLEGSEIQCETDEQRASLLQAVADAFANDLSNEELMAKRYPNYSGEADQWDIVTLLNKYLVPEGKTRLDDSFYKERNFEDVIYELQDLKAELGG